ncbi:hypothetical protein HK097_009667 [Rhizophlyctis rosea]|uniref:F-box domain-containing protein n=1 Tax=Rhizophlyctis rosea TaxID=64517 RepID=A0AAD5SKN0_9FUNG|nr:hypothetical protein HK097_009667 [Rhizophlyctis rosea]
MNDGTSAGAIPSSAISSQGGQTAPVAGASQSAFGGPVRPFNFGSLVTGEVGQIAPAAQTAFVGNSASVFGQPVLTKAAGSARSASEATDEFGRVRKPKIFIGASGLGHAEKKSWSSTPSLSNGTGSRIRFGTGSQLPTLMAGTYIPKEELLADPFATEFWVSILTLLDPATICRTERVCRIWKTLHRREANSIWRNKVRVLTKEGTVPYLLKDETFKLLYKIHCTWERVGDWRVADVGTAKIITEMQVGGMVRNSSVFGVAAAGTAWRGPGCFGKGIRGSAPNMEIAGKTAMFYSRRDSPSVYALPTNTHNYYKEGSSRFPPDSTSVAVYHGAPADKREAKLFECCRTDLMGTITWENVGRSDGQQGNASSADVYFWDSKTLRRSHAIRDLSTKGPPLRAILCGMTFALITGGDGISIFVYQLHKGEATPEQQYSRWLNNPDGTHLLFALDEHRIASYEHDLTSIGISLIGEEDEQIYLLLPKDGIVRLDFTRTHFVVAHGRDTISSFSIYSLDTYECKNTIKVDLKPFQFERVRFSDCGAYVSILSATCLTTGQEVWDPHLSILDIVMGRAYGWEQVQEGVVDGKVVRGRKELVACERERDAKYRRMEVRVMEGRRQGFFLWHGLKNGGNAFPLRCEWVDLSC